MSELLTSRRGTAEQPRQLLATRNVTLVVDCEQNGARRVSRRVRKTVQARNGVYESNRRARERAHDAVSYPASYLCSRAPVCTVKRRLTEKGTRVSDERQTRTLSHFCDTILKETFVYSSVELGQPALSLK